MTFFKPDCIVFSSALPFSVTDVFVFLLKAWVCACPLESVGQDSVWCGRWTGCRGFSRAHLQEQSLSSKVESPWGHPVLCTSKGGGTDWTQEDRGRTGQGAQRGASVCSRHKGQWHLTWALRWSGTVCGVGAESTLQGGTIEQRQEVPAMCMPSVAVFWLPTVGWGADRGQHRAPVCAPLWSTLRR